MALWVEDMGIGIPADALPQLFSHLYRGRNAQAHPGSGLGLAIVKAIAENHGGHTQAVSPGLGTRFTLNLAHPTGSKAYVGSGVKADNIWKCLDIIAATGREIPSRRKPAGTC